MSDENESTIDAAAGPSGTESPVINPADVPVSSEDSELARAVAEFRAKLPGWWFTVGECSVSCDASVGPDRAYVPEPMLSKFDAGFDCDLRQPSTMAEALRAATMAAVEATSVMEQDGNEREAKL